MPRIALSSIGTLGRVDAGPATAALHLAAIIKAVEAFTTAVAALVRAPLMRSPRIAVNVLCWTHGVASLANSGPAMRRRAISQ